MASDLSQQEIDQLVSGDADEAEGAVAAEGLQQRSDVKLYDFRKPANVSKEHLKACRSLHESFAELFSFYLASQVQTSTSVELIALDQLYYSEYVMAISNPCVLYLFSMDELYNRAAIELSPELVFVIVERLLGGAGTKMETSRGITAIEQKITEPIVRKMLSVLHEAWEPLYNVAMSFLGFEHNAEFAQIAPFSESVIVVSFQIRINEETYMMNICYPSFPFEIMINQSRQTQFSNVSSVSQLQNQARITGHLGKTRMDLTAVLGTSSITVADLMELEKGDILVLDQRVEEQIGVKIQDHLKYRGVPGTVDGRMAIRVTQKVESLLLKENLT